MNEQNYWTRLYRRRLSRRRLLRDAGLGATGLAGLALIGCGDGGEGKPTATAGATGTTATVQVTKGGTFRDVFFVDPPSLDPYKFVTALVKRPANYVYSRLFKLDAGPGVPYSAIKIVPDAAESYEVTPDGITYTVKLKGNVRFHPPIDRLMTAEDVVFSVKRFRGQTADYAGAQNKDALELLESVQVMDARTVVFKLKRPFFFFPLRLADPSVLQIMPLETGTAFDPTKTMVGSGPWIFDGYTPSVVVKFRRNPNWHFGPDLPYLDRVEQYTILDRTVILNQFLGGNLDRGGAEQPGDVQKVRQTIPGAKIITTRSLGLSCILFSLDDHPDSPWLKQEVRQAVSMAIDRNTLLDGAYNYKELQGQGLDLKYEWHNFVPAPLSDYWLDPQGKDAKAAQNFKYDPEGARRLLAEAGYPEGFNATFTNSTGITQGGLGVMWELIMQMLSKVGINLTVKMVDWNNVMVPQVWAGKFDGISANVTSAYVDPTDYLGPFVRKNSPRNFSKVEDLNLEAKIDKMESSLDEKDLRRQIVDIQNYLDQKMYWVPLVSAVGLTLYQPYIRNAVEYHTLLGGYTGTGTEQLPYVWLDR